MPTSARYLRLPAAEPSPPSMPSVSPSSAALSPPDRDAKPSSTSPALVRTLTKAPLEWGAWLDAAIGSVIAAGAPRSPPYKLAAPAAARQSVLKPPTMPPPEGGEQLQAFEHGGQPARQGKFGNVASARGEYRRRNDNEAGDALPTG